MKFEKFIEIVSLFSLFIFILWILYRYIKANLGPSRILPKKTVVMITGGCLGLGRQLARIIAQTHRCTLVVWDIRDDLAPGLSIKEEFL